MGKKRVEKSSDTLTDALTSGLDSGTIQALANNKQVNKQVSDVLEILARNRDDFDSISIIKQLANSPHCKLPQLLDPLTQTKNDKFNDVRFEWLNKIMHTVGAIETWGQANSIMETIRSLHYNYNDEGKILDIPALTLNDEEQNAISQDRIWHVFHSLITNQQLLPYANKIIKNDKTDPYLRDVLVKLSMMKRGHSLIEGYFAVANPDFETNMKNAYEAAKAPNINALKTIFQQTEAEPADLVCYGFKKGMDQTDLLLIINYFDVNVKSIEDKLFNHIDYFDDLTFLTQTLGLDIKYAESFYKKAKEEPVDYDVLSWFKEHASESTLAAFEI